MKIERISYILASITLLASCATIITDVNKITEVYVADFNSEDMESCRPSDVDLNHSDAHEFFLRAKQVDTKILHDYYNYAPCYIEGILKYKSNTCNWEIRAGATGHISCQKDKWYFACDNCNDLFKEK